MKYRKSDTDSMNKIISSIKLSPQLELKDILVFQNPPIQMGFCCPMPTPDEPFATTLSRCVEYLCGGEEEQITEYENILHSFELYGSFLNSIPLKERYEIIHDKLLVWMIEYTDKDTNELYIYGEPPKEIKKDINIIEKFEEMIFKRLWGLNSEIYNELNNQLQQIKNDLQKEKFQIIPKEAYYGLPAIRKKELTEILSKIVKEYNIKGTSVSKKQLVDSI